MPLFPHRCFRKCFYEEKNSMASATNLAYAEFVRLFTNCDDTVVCVVRGGFLCGWCMSLGLMFD